MDNGDSQLNPLSARKNQKVIKDSGEQHGISQHLENYFTWLFDSKNYALHFGFTYQATTYKTNCVNKKWIILAHLDKFSLAFTRTDCYRLIIFIKSLFITILSNNLDKNSTKSDCFV